MKLTGENQSTREKICPSATLSTTNPTWTDLGSKLGLRVGRPATYRLSHGCFPVMYMPAVYIYIYISLKFTALSHTILILILFP
jgi:hypothetical protein